MGRKKFDERKKFEEHKKFYWSARNFTGAQEILLERKKFDGRKKFDDHKKFYRNARHLTKTQEIQRRTYGDAIRKNATNLTATGVSLIMQQW